MSVTFTWNNPNTSEYFPEEIIIYREEVEFESSELPVAFDTLPGSATSFTDETALDGVTYYYRVSFKLGIREAVSRIIQIKAPTTPDLFETFAIETSCYPNLLENFYNNMCVAVDDFNDFKYPTFAGSNAFGLRWYTESYKAEESILIRMGAMLAIQRFKREVWLTETFALENPVTAWGLNAWSVTDTTHGFASVKTSGIASGSVLTWKEAFDIMAQATDCMDICVNVIHHLRTDIAMSLTSLRGQPSTRYTSLEIGCIFMEFVYDLGRFKGAEVPVRGVDAYLVAISNRYANLQTSYIRNRDPLGLLRTIRAIFRSYPEIKDAFKVKDLSQTLTYSKAGVVTDWLSENNNDSNKADPLQSLAAATYETANPNFIASMRSRGLSDEFLSYGDMYAASSIASHMNDPTGYRPALFFMTKTPNGKDFAATILNSYSSNRAAFALACWWNRVSAFNGVYTDGLSETDPQEALVVLRYRPEEGLVDLSARGTTMTILGSPDMAKHRLGVNMDAGFPDPALALLGSDSARMNAMVTDLNMMSYVRAGTSFTIEMFLSNAGPSAGSAANAWSDLISLGANDSGRFVTVCAILAGFASVALQTYTSHTSSDTFLTSLGNTGVGKGLYTKAQYDEQGGNNHRFHVVLQYDAIKGRFELFVNGVIIRIWTPFTTTADAFLTFFGKHKSPSDVTTIITQPYAELLTHEIVVTLGKRYNYGCFIGKVPFAKKRHLA